MRLTPLALAFACWATPALAIEKEFAIFEIFDHFARSHGWAETPEQREARLAHERMLFAEAQAQFDRGEYFEFDEVAEWLATLDSDEEVPLPQPKQR